LSRTIFTKKGPTITKMIDPLTVFIHWLPLCYYIGLL